MNLPENEENPENNNNNNTTNSRNVSITVTDGTSPIAGASVTIDGVTRTTGSAGGCTFQDVADGTKTVSVSATGYESNTSEIVVSEGQTSFEITLDEL